MNRMPGFFALGLVSFGYLGTVSIVKAQDHPMQYYTPDSPRGLQREISELKRTQSELERKKAQLIKDRDGLNMHLVDTQKMLLQKCKDLDEMNIQLINTQNTLIQKCKDLDFLNRMLVAAQHTILRNHGQDVPDDVPPVVVFPPETVVPQPSTFSITTVSHDSKPGAMDERGGDNRRLAFSPLAFSSGSDYIHVSQLRDKNWELERDTTQLVNDRDALNNQLVDTQNTLIQKGKDLNAMNIQLINTQNSLIRKGKDVEFINDMLVGAQNTICREHDGTTPDHKDHKTPLPVVNLHPVLEGPITVVQGGCCNFYMTATNNDRVATVSITLYQTDAFGKRLEGGKTKPISITAAKHQTDIDCDKDRFGAVIRWAIDPDKTEFSR